MQGKILLGGWQRRGQDYDQWIDRKNISR